MFLKSTLSILFTLFASIGFCQLHNIDLVKTPLSFQNPALQIDRLDKFAVSVNGLNQPFVDEGSDIINYLGLLEFNLGKNWHVGLHTNHLESKLFYETEYKFFISKSFELEEGHFFNIGLDVGSFEEKIKALEFNKVLTPNRFVYTDSTNSNLDIGFGMAYLSDNFTFAYSVKKLNRPLILPFPLAVVEFINDTTYFLVDTTVSYSSKNRVRSGFRHSIHLLFNWDYSSNVKISHSFYFADISPSQIGFSILQNNIEFNKKLNIGAGISYESSIGFTSHLSYNLLKNLNIGGSAYFTQVSRFNEQTRNYENIGFSPWFEGRLLLKI